MDATLSRVLRWRKPVYIFMGILLLAMITMSGVEAWFLVTTPDPDAYGAIQPSSAGLPTEDQRGAFLVLNAIHDPKFKSNLVLLLSTTEAGVVDTSKGAHLQPEELDSVLIQSANISMETQDYRITTVGDPTDFPLTYDRKTGGKELNIRPKSGVWRPGAYLVDIPSEGMFGGRDYFQFYIDAKPTQKTP